MTDSATYPASRLKLSALHWLRRKHPGAVLTFELSVQNWGAALLDVAAILPDRLIGVEVKGDRDSHQRIDRQGIVYSQAVERLWLLPAPTIAERIRKHTPWFWGILGVDDEGVGLTVHSEAARLDHFNNAAVLAGVLWAPEAIGIARLHIDRLRRETGHYVIPKGGGECQWLLGEHLPLSIVRREVCEALYRRDWRGRRGYPCKQVWRPDDPLPDPGATADAA